MFRTEKLDTASWRNIFLVQLPGICQIISSPAVIQYTVKSMFGCVPEVLRVTLRGMSWLTLSFILPIGSELVCCWPHQLYLSSFITSWLVADYGICPDELSSAPWEAWWLDADPNCSLLIRLLKMVITFLAKFCHFVCLWAVYAARVRVNMWSIGHSGVCLCNLANCATNQHTLIFDNSCLEPLCFLGRALVHPFSSKF